VLSLHKPFREAAELRPDGQTWNEALVEFERTASARVKRLVQNLRGFCAANTAHREDMAAKLVDPGAGVELDDEYVHASKEDWALGNTNYVVCFLSHLRTDEEEGDAENEVSLEELSQEDAVFKSKLSVQFDPAGDKNEGLLRQSFVGVTRSTLDLFGAAACSTRSSASGFSGKDGWSCSIAPQPESILKTWRRQGDRWNKEAKEAIAEQKKEEERKLRYSF